VLLAGMLARERGYGMRDEQYFNIKKNQVYCESPLRTNLLGGGIGFEVSRKLVAPIINVIISHSSSNESDLSIGLESAPGANLNSDSCQLSFSEQSPLCGLDVCLARTLIFFDASQAQLWWRMSEGSTIKFLNSS
jgi:hypothetical protein